MARAVVEFFRRRFAGASDLQSGVAFNLPTRLVSILNGLVGLLLFSAIACNPSVSMDSRELLELERMEFVPAGSTNLVDLRRYSDFAIDRPLMVDRFEATLGDWRHYFPEDDGSNQTSSNVEVEPDTWPVGLTFLDAERLAEARGMRLLTAVEWIYIAVGPRGHPFPWGPSSRSSVANTLELRLDRPVAVGTFENGVGPFGCHDLLGNVWEWVSGLAPGVNFGLGFSDGTHAPLVSVMGGSWRSHMNPIYGGGRRLFNAMTIDPRTWGRDLGVRHGAEASEYLWEHSAHWGTSEGVRRRLLAVGQRFGDEAVALLDELSSRPGASPTLAWLAEGAKR
ncbi:MAG: hypothetical protein ACI8TQ_000562 [Planctomycetota bacterium]|jgi:hypothetical protein